MTLHKAAYVLLLLLFTGLTPSSRISAGDGLIALCDRAGSSNVGRCQLSTGSRQRLRGPPAMTGHWPPAGRDLRPPAVPRVTDRSHPVTRRRLIAQLQKLQ